MFDNLTIVGTLVAVLVATIIAVAYWGCPFCGDRSGK